MEVRALKVLIYVDGSTDPNPGPSGIGVVITDAKGKTLKEYAEPIGKASCNRTEYVAVQRGLEMAKQLGAKTVELFSDSQLVVEQVAGNFKVRNLSLTHPHSEIKRLQRKFTSCSIARLPRHLNSKAHELANKGRRMNSVNKAGLKRYDTSRYEQECCLCASAIQVGEGPIYWDPTTKEVCHVSCFEAANNTEPEQIAVRNAQLLRGYLESRGAYDTYVARLIRETVTAAVEYVRRQEQPDKALIKPSSFLEIEHRGVMRREGRLPDGDEEYDLAESAGDRVATGRRYAALDGLYTVVGEGFGHKDCGYRTLALKTQSVDATFMPGEQLIYFLSDSEDLNDFKQFGILRANGGLTPWKNFKGGSFQNEVAFLTAMIRTDPLIWGTEFAKRYNRCWRCCQATDFKKNPKGLGPDCLRKTEEALRGRS